MSTLTPLTSLENALLARFVRPGRTWWVVGDTEPAMPLADLVPMLVPDAESALWVVRVEGQRQRTRYVTEGAGVEDHTGRAVSAVLGPLSLAEAVALLDRAETVGVSALLVLGDDTEPVAGREGPRGWDPTSLDGARVVVLAEPGARRAVVGVLAERPPAMAGVSIGRAPEPEAPPPLAPPGMTALRPVVSRPWALALLAVLLAGAAGSGSWLALRDGAGKTTPLPRAPAPATPAAKLATMPAPQYPPAVVFDPARGNTMAFGGGEPANTPVTWLWAKQGWRPATEGVAPTDRFGSAAAYDPATGTVLLFGGREIPGGVPNDTWSWDGRTWTEVGLPGAGPPGYEFSGMAWDEAHAQMVLVTPAPDPGANGVATWTWTGARWRRMLGSAAPPLVTSAMAFDPVTRTVLLVTGSNPSSIPSSVASTWSWDGTSWHELHPAHEPDIGPFLARIPGTDQLIGAPSTSSSGSARATWTWDGRDWAAHSGDLTLRDYAALVADDSAGAVTAFGAGNGSSLGAAWAWTGAHWARLAVTSDPTGAAATVHPGARDFAASAFDQGRGQLVLYGGQARGVGPTPATVVDTDTWTFSGGLWTRSPTTTHPPSSGPAAYDPGSGQVILVADANGALAIGTPLARPVTWGWDGHSWQALHPRTELPRGSPPIAMTTDPATRTVLAITLCCQASDGPLTGGNPPQTWTWNGSTWVPGGPTAEFRGGRPVHLAYDAASRRVLAVGGNDRGPASTWAWNAATWTELHPPNAAVVEPLTAVMAADPSTLSVVLVEARFQTAFTFNDAGGTLVWNGSTWTDNLSAVLSAADTAYGAAAMFEDPGLARLALVSSSTGDFSEEWMWTGVAWLQLALG